MNARIVNNTYEALVETIEAAEKLASKPNMTPAEVRQHSTLLAKAKILGMGVDPQTLQVARANAIRRELGIKDDAPVAKVSDEYREAFREYVRTGKAVELRDQTSTMWGRPSGQTYVGGNLSGSTTSGVAGGYTTPAEFLAEAASMNLGSYDQIVDEPFSTMVRTDTGSVCPVPVFDDVSGSPAAFVKSRIVPDATQDNQGTSLIGAASSQAIFGKAWKYSTACSVSLELERDAAAVLSVLLPMVMRQRHQMGIGDGFVNGSGNGAPLGISTVAATLSGSNVITSTSNSAPTLKDFQKALRALPLQYRSDAVWFMNSSTLLDVWEFLDTANRANVGGEYYLLGRRIAVCESMAAVNAGTLCAILTSPRVLLQRRVNQGGTAIERYFELPGYAESGQVLIKSIVRVDLLPTLYASQIPPYVAVYLGN